MLTGVPRDDALRLTSLDVRAIPAYKELLVEYAAALLEALGIPWNPPEVVGRFRDKFALKEYIRTVDPSVRMNASRMVTDADQVMAAAVSEEFSRFVLKPVGGLGNKDVLLCPDGADESTIADYFRDAVGPGGSCVMEEFLTGEEYYVDGQVDDARQVTPVAIQKYLRGTVGDRTNIALEHETIRPDDPVFDAIFTYARELIAATGLRRSPFHMEIMVDDRGPCMVECGARLVGWSAAVEDSADHGPQLDVVQVAGHYWLSPQHLDIPLDFEHYLSRYALHLVGNTTECGITAAVRGIEGVAGHPGFVRWIRQPRVGRRVEPTVSTDTILWGVHLQAASERELRAAKDFVVRTLQIDVVPAQSARGRLARSYSAVHHTRKALTTVVRGRRLYRTR